MQEDIPAFAEWDDYDKIKENQVFPNGESGMNALIYQKSHETGHNSDIARKVGPQQKLGPLKKPHVSAEEKIDEVESNSRKHPGQGWRGGDF